MADVVRREVFGIGVTLFFEEVRVERQPLPAVLDVVDDVQFVLDRLDEPDSGTVADADVPAGIDRVTRPVRD